MTLEKIRARALNCRNYNFGLRAADKLAHDDAFRLLAAVDGVLAVHPKLCRILGAACHEDKCDAARCGSCGGKYPCPTVAVLTALLGEGE